MKREVSQKNFHHITKSVLLFLPIFLKNEAFFWQKGGRNLTFNHRYFIITAKLLFKNLFKIAIAIFYYYKVGL
jgi:hypothetical protein